MKKDNLLIKAKQYRRNGYSLREISDILKISKSTASLWLRDIKISPKGRERQKLKIKESKKRQKEVIKQKQEEKYNEILRKCRVLINRKTFTNDEFKLFLALLYWGEGAKTGRRVVFMNSDPQIIKAFLILFRNSFNLDENKFSSVLHLHSYHNVNNMKNYWSRITGIKKKRITIYRKLNTGKRKKENYRGCISIRYGDSKIFDEIFIIIERFIQNLIAGVG